MVLKYKIGDIIFCKGEFSVVLTQDENKIKYYAVINGQTEVEEHATMQLAEAVHMAKALDTASKDALDPKRMWSSEKPTKNTEGDKNLN